MLSAIRTTRIAMTPGSSSAAISIAIILAANMLRTLFGAVAYGRVRIVNTSRD